MMNVQEALKKLPSSWDEITVKQFQDLSETPITDNQDEFDGIENSLAVISKFIDVPVEELEQQPMKDISTLANKLAFMLQPPAPQKQTLLKWKNIEQITFNDYVSFLQVQSNPLQNLGMIVKTFTISELNEDDIMALPVTEITSGFFLFNQELRRYIQRSIKSARMKLIKLKLKGWLWRTKK